MELLRFANAKEQLEFKAHYQVIYNFLNETLKDLQQMNFNYKESCSFLTELYIRILGFEVPVQPLRVFFKITDEIFTLHNMLLIDGKFYFDPSINQFCTNSPHIFKILDNKKYGEPVKSEKPYLFSQKLLCSKFCSGQSFLNLFNTWLDFFIKSSIQMRQNDLQHYSFSRYG